MLNQVRCLAYLIYDMFLQKWLHDQTCIHLVVFFCERVHITALLSADPTSIVVSLSLPLPSCLLLHSLIHTDTRINSPKLLTKLPIFRSTASACQHHLIALNYLKTGKILMELQLELELSVPDSTRGFDLNRNACDGKDVFGSDPRTCLCAESTSHGKRYKRDFEDAFFKTKGSFKEMSLLLWNGHPNKEDDDRKDTNERSSCTTIHMWVQPIFFPFYFLKILFSREPI